MLLKFISSNNIKNLVLIHFYRLADRGNDVAYNIFTILTLYEQAVSAIFYAPPDPAYSIRPGQWPG